MSKKPRVTGFTKRMKERAKTKAKIRLAGEAADKIAAKYTKLAERTSGATMNDFFKATPGLSVDQVRHRIIVLKGAGTIEMHGPRAKAIYKVAS